MKIRSRLILSRLISPQAPTGQFSGGENAGWWTFPPCPLQALAIYGNIPKTIRYLWFPMEGLYGYLVIQSI